MYHIKEASEFATCIFFVLSLVELIYKRFIIAKDLKGLRVVHIKEDGPKHTDLIGTIVGLDETDIKVQWDKDEPSGVKTFQKKDFYKTKTRLLLLDNAQKGTVFRHFII